MTLELGKPQIDPSAIVAPTAVIAGSVTLAPRAFILFGVVIRAEIDTIYVGEDTNIQDNSVVHCDDRAPCAIGDRVTVGHLALIHGAQVGNNCLIGMGAKVLNGAEVGEGAWVGSGALLPEGKKIPPWTLALGTPAKPIRELTEAEIERQRKGVEDYQALAKIYSKSG